jgi:hypothetical protein
MLELKLWVILRSQDFYELPKIFRCILEMYFEFLGACIPIEIGQ